MAAHMHLFVALVSLLGFVIGQSASSTSSASKAVSTDGFCGSNTNQICLGSTYGNCCSSKGYCGSTSSYCDSGCQKDFGNCSSSATSVSVDGSCGGATGEVCLGSTFGDCCSGKGYCGGNASYCDTGCQSNFGHCSATTSASSTSSASSTTSTPSTAAASSSLTSPSQKKTPFNQTTGFLAGMGVLGGVLGLLLIGSLLFFLYRRRRTQKNVGAVSEMYNEAPADKGYNKRSELVAHPSELSGVTTYRELPAHEQHTNEKDRMAKVDDRAAAGYEGAYRGN